MTSVVFLLLFGMQAPAQATDPSTAFNELLQSGVQSYRDKKYDVALESFTKALEIAPNDVSVLTNLALTRFQKGERGWALGLFRKALSLSPNFPTAQEGEAFVAKQMPVKEIPHQLEWWEVFRRHMLAPISIQALLLICLLFFAFSGWTLISLLGSRRRALLEEKPTPNFNFIHLLFILGFLFSSTLVVAKTYDSMTVRATIVKERIEARALPDAQAISLFELYEGLEVIVKNRDKDWLQVKYPGGPVGWVMESDLFVTTHR